MKIRYGFVANSSSASFSISKKYLSEKQINMIKNHIGYRKIKKYKQSIYCDNRDAWDIMITDDEVKGETIMTNFDMKTFLLKIGVPIDKIHYDVED